MRTIEYIITSIFVLGSLFFVLSHEGIITIEKNYYPELQQCQKDLKDFSCPEVQCKDSAPFASIIFYILGAITYTSGLWFMLDQGNKWNKRKSRTK